jgi:hypothetical protein
LPLCLFFQKFLACILFLIVIGLTVCMCIPPLAHLSGALPVGLAVLSVLYWVELAKYGSLQLVDASAFIQSSSPAEGAGVTSRILVVSMGQQLELQETSRTRRSTSTQLLGQLPITHAQEEVLSWTERMRRADQLSHESRALELQVLAADFTFTAEVYSSLLVLELQLPPDRRSLLHVADKVHDESVSYHRVRDIEFAVATSPDGSDLLLKRWRGCVAIQHLVQSAADNSPLTRLHVPLMVRVSHCGVMLLVQACAYEAAQLRTPAADAAVATIIRKLQLPQNGPLPKLGIDGWCHVPEFALVAPTVHTEMEVKVSCCVPCTCYVVHYI